MEDIGWVVQRQEGQFFERKSCYDRGAGRRRRRPVSDVARDVAEAMAAMANADG
jgi:hypothetical protein